MTGAAIGLVLISALLHATWNALLKQARDTEAAAVIVVLGASLVSGVLALTVGPRQIPSAAVPWLLAAGAIEGVYFVTLAAALHRLPLQSAYGISRGLGVLIVWPVAALGLGEAVSALSLGGAALLSFGLFVQMRAVPRSSGVLFALACAGAIALYPVTYKRAIDLGIAEFSLFALSLAMAAPLQLLTLGRARVTRLRAAVADRNRLVIASSLCAASFLVFLSALKTQGPAHVSALRNTSVLVAAMYGWARGETFDARNVLSAAAIALGALLVAL